MSRLLSSEEIQRYSRHLTLSEVGMAGQERLKQSRVLLVGSGGLGSPMALYLAAAGVGYLTVIDGDTVDHSNLQRQVLYATEDVGRLKVEAALQALHRVNPNVQVEAVAERLNPENVEALFAEQDVIADGSDNFRTRYLVNDAAYFAQKPLVSASLFQFQGQLSVFHPNSGGPCYRCLYSAPPPASLVPT
jgi:molybdopterin/thiamine biosynthesis adenylyltransferase